MTQALYSIDARSLSRYFGDVKAVDDVSFTVDSGEIFGFLGPNGAGKSTTMMIMTTLLKPTSGRVLVSGHDVTVNPTGVRQNMGYVQQETTADEYLTGRENLTLQARLNHLPKSQADSRIDELLDIVELADRQNEAVLGYSGGMRKRLDIAGGLLHRPKVLFLDEPTVGLDIQTRRKIWNYITKIHNEFDMSIFLTTHYMEEADILCDRIGIIDHGKIQTIDSPQNLKSMIGSEVIYLSLKDPTEQFLSELNRLDKIISLEHHAGKITLFTSDSKTVIPTIFRLSFDMKAKIDTISMTQPTLDDAFLSYTGHEIRDDEGYNRERERAKMKRLRA